MSSITSWFTARLLAIILLLSSAMSTVTAPVAMQNVGEEGSYIVQSTSAEAAAAAVTTSGGTVSRTLPIIDGVAAMLPASAVQRLAAMRGIALHSDNPVRAADYVEPTLFGSKPTPTPTASGSTGKETKTQPYSWLYPSAATSATQLHATQVTTPKTACQNQRVTVSSTNETRPLQGWGVTIAVVDSGFLAMKKSSSWINRDAATGTLETEYGGRCMVYRDFLPRSSANANNGTAANNSVDQYGHGTHVISSIADSRTTQLAANGALMPVGVAPQVNLMIARALGADGSGTYSDVISAIDWIVANKATYNVRVLNLSLYSPVNGPYWADPINQAVMKAWQAGIVVVAAAGNEGSDAGTITVPGNVPYVITAGAIKSGRYTTSGYDELATYSSRGPTESAFVKPDVLVPASQTIAPVPNTAMLASQIPDASIKEKTDVKDYLLGNIFESATYYRLSGTSMAAAQVSGLAALMLQASPNLTNDQVKYRMMATAMPAIDTTTNQAVYTPWEQGAGMVDIVSAVSSTLTDSANQGMDIATDLDPNGSIHYWGYTTWNPVTNQFALLDPTTGGQLAVWDGGSRSWAGGSRSWAGGSRSWAGGSRSWAGGSRSWAGGSRSWAGSDSLWAGGSRSWAGSTTVPSLNTASYTELITDN